LQVEGSSEESIDYMLVKMLDDEAGEEWEDEKREVTFYTKAVPELLVS